MSRRSVFILLLAVLLGGGVFAFVRLRGVGEDVFAQHRRLGRGINLGNSLEAKPEGSWGFVIQDEDLPRIKAAGFDSVRIPVKWSAYAAPTAPYVIDPVFLRRVDHVVRTAIRSGLVVLLDVHHYEELDAHPAEHRERLAAIWDQVAAHFADCPDRVLQFEVYNEPYGTHTAELWNQTFPPSLRAIRRHSPTRAVHVGSVMWNQIPTLKDLRLPPEDRHIIIHLHYYDPFQFTHQGAFWIKGADQWVGRSWDATEAQLKKIRNDFDQAAEWARKENRPVFFGEFGTNLGVKDMAARVRWTKTIVTEAEARGFKWAYWEYQAYFGVWDPKKKEWRKEILDALMSGKK